MKKNFAMSLSQMYSTVKLISPVPVKAVTTWMSLLVIVSPYYRLVTTFQHWFHMS
jgi:hypothetical protein